MATQKRRSTTSSTAIPEFKDDPVSSYAANVVAGKIVACRLVRLACQRHLNDLKSAHKRGLRWSLPHALYAINFFPYLKHSKGEFGGKPVVLEPWQQFVVGSVWGWLRGDGTRRFRYVYEELPRKNGKSTKLSGIGLLGLVADKEPGAEVYAAATRKDQARIIFDEAKRMVRSSPQLASRVQTFKLNLSVDETGSKFEPLSSDEKTLDGLNPHVVLVDEFHKHKSRAVLDVLDTALGARRQPILWIITTAGDDDPSSAYANENAYAISVLEGTVQDDNIFAFITTIDKGDRWDDPVAWAKANPNLGVSVKIDDLKRQADKAKRSPMALTAFLRLRLNVRTANAESLIDMDIWRRNSRLKRPEYELLRGRRCFGGLDLSSKTDLSAWVKVFPPIPDDPQWRVMCNFWLPSENLEAREDRDRAAYRMWVKDHYIDVTPGNVIDHSAIEQQIREDATSFDLHSVAYDTWNAAQLASRLYDEGVEMREFIQGFRSYNAPTKELLALLASESLEHGNNPVLNWMAGNVRGLKDKNENVMPSKKHSTGRIDGMTALIMGIGRAIDPTNEDGIIGSDFMLKEV